MTEQELIEAGKLIRTGMSQVFWCESAGGGREQGKILIEAAKNVTIGGEKYLHLSWMDWLLNGGLHLPASGKPLLILISGPPGSGKTTFALELCYRLATNKYPSGDSIGNKQQFLSLYLSGDTEAADMVANAESMDWKDFQNIRVIVEKNGSSEKIAGQIEQVTGTNKVDPNHKKQPILLWGRSDLPNFLERTSSEDGGVKITFGFVLDIMEFGVELDEGDIKHIARKFITRSQKKIRLVPPDILVLDSLNIIKDADKQSDDFLNIYTKLVSPVGEKKAPKIIVLVADSRYEDAGSKHMAYLADTVIRLEYDSSYDYFRRYLEIEKTRFQGHTLGKHYFKIMHGYSPNSTSDIRDDNILIQRSSPYRKEGGIFLCPSIHSYLSQYRKTSAPPPTGDLLAFPKTIKPNFFKFPVGRCTTFIGDRGAHKSHFAYTQLLNYLVTKKTTGAIVVSMREDEKKTPHTLEMILKQVAPRREWH